MTRNTRAKRGCIQMELVLVVVSFVCDKWLEWHASNVERVWFSVKTCHQAGTMHINIILAWWTLQHTFGLLLAMKTLVRQTTNVVNKCLNM